jgi:tetratricopeptide (TPR) repeat protein
MELMKSHARLGLVLAAWFVASCHASPSARTPGSAETAAQVASRPSVGFAVAAAPLSLTASDGTTLRLATLRAQAVVDGPLAFTEVHMTFDNPEARTLEGTFRITLPQAASMGRFAMKIGEEWQEGEVVEIAAARRAYEDFLHRKQDPALLEKSAGNEFSARVFPIPANASKEIVVSWVEEIHGPYVLALRGLPALDALDVEARVLGAGQPVPKMSSVRQAPSADYVVDVAKLVPAVSTAKASAVRSGELAIVQVRPQPTSKPDPLDDVLVLVDTSASRALGFEAEIDLVESIAKAVGKGAMTVACFDQTVATVFQGRGDALAAAPLAKIRERGALGASDLERALGWAADAAKASKAKRVVLLTDGVATAGTTDPTKLGAKVAALKSSGVERVDAVAIGGIRDDAALSRLVRGNLVRDGVVARVGADQIEKLVRRLSEATVSGIAVKVEGAKWSWPSKLDGVQAGDTYSVYAEVPASKELRVTIDGKAEPALTPRGTGRDLLERAVVQAKVSSMLEREAGLGASPELRADLRKSIVTLATRHRIMTPYTAMLVLETDADYQRYGIDRKSLADVLAIQKGVVTRLHRKGAPLPEADTLAYLNMDVGEEVQAQKLGPNETGVAPKPKTEVSAANKKSLDRSDSWGGDPSSATPPAAMHPRAPRPVARAAPPAAAATQAPMMLSPPAAEPRAEARGSMWSALEGADRDADPDDENGNIRDAKRPYEGRFATVMEELKLGQVDEALATARAWHAEAAGDVLALTALGEAAEAKGMTELASRAYGSVVDLFPNRADLRRFAGERLERLSKDRGALDLAIDTFEKALADRPDHPSSHRLLTFALLRKGLYARAFDQALAGARQPYEVDRFLGVERILREDIGLVGAAWAHAEPKRRDEILRRVRDAGAAVEDKPSLRFVLNWETDANDVDFHIHDGRGGHAFYSRPRLRSGGELYADVTTGYGPECFTIRTAKAKRAGPYRLEAHYYSRGPMGYGMGKLEVIEHDGNGALTFEERPFVVMVDSAFVDLGTVR